MRRFSVPVKRIVKCRLLLMLLHSGVVAEVVLLWGGRDTVGAHLQALGRFSKVGLSHRGMFDTVYLVL